MTDKSEEEKSRAPATDAGPIEPENQDRSVSDADPKGNRKRTDKVDRKNGSIATRFKKGKSGNPKGRPKKVATDPDVGLGDILQAIDNEVVVVVIGGKRTSVTMAEAHFQGLFGLSSKGDLKAAKLIMGMAVKYFGPDPEGKDPSATHWFVLPDEYYDNPDAYKDVDLKKIGRWDGPPPQAIQRPLPVGYLFRKVASQEVAIDVYGTRMKMPRWNAYVRRIYMMAQDQHMGAAKLLDQLREKFPGKALPGAPITMIISEADTRL